MDWLILINFCCCCCRLLSGSMSKIQKVHRQFLITKTQRSNDAMPPQLGYILPVLTSLKYVPFASFPNTYTYYAWQVENLHYSVDVIHFQKPSITQTHTHSRTQHTNAQSLLYMYFSWWNKIHTRQHMHPKPSQSVTEKTNSVREQWHWKVQ